MSDDQSRDDRRRRRPVGPFGWTAKQRQKYKRTKKWPKRAIEVPDGPLGLTLTSLPSKEYLRGYADALAGRSPMGPKRKMAEDIALILTFLAEIGDDDEQMRKLFIVERGRADIIDEQPRPSLIVGPTSTRLAFRKAGKRVIDLSPEERSVLSKRFTRAMKEMRRRGLIKRRRS